ncbi:MAG TPA: glucodextranase DOMON-like domain-containing protein [Aggregatilineales bacterium]|nr:glucodextranase DOMON-like domain-containing protein [Aggregatilineales bacterium]
MKRVSMWFVLLMITLAACAGPGTGAQQTPTGPAADMPEPTAGATGAPAPDTSEPTAESGEAGRAPLTIEDGKLYVAIIWHQHQPVYFKDPDTGLYQRPWVRVHATKDYVDMAAILKDYPDIHATFNLTPSLIRQLDDLSAGAKDLYWAMAEIPAAELADEEKAFIRDRFFDASDKMIARFPRYAELAAMRSEPIEAWSEQDFRDLQVLFNLAWTDPDWLAQEPLAALVEKGEDFSEKDKEVLFAEHLRLVQEVIPLHAEMQQSGQIEVTMTPFAHPILPLLVDSNLAAPGLPDADLPERFTFGQDAVAQVELGVQFYEEHFGQPPRGMWPAEGSVAQGIVTMVSQAGIEWMATDEDVLANSLPGFEGFTRGGDDTIQQADVLYRPYEVQGARGGPVAILFRDKRISDLVGFEYSGTPGEEAAADLIARLENIRARLEEEGAEGPHLVTILLDGENAWEHYDEDGKPFLHEMYRLLSESESIVTVTPSEYLDALRAEGVPLPAIENLWPGSWIDGTFSTWIGEEEENLAWEYLLRTRTALQRAITSGEVDEATLEEALTAMYIAEGSDWFWWYGADQNSGDDGAFDVQFRRYLEQVYTILGQEPPGFVSVPIIPAAAVEPDRAASDLISPTIDGVEGADEWAGGGFYTFEQAGLTGLAYGFDEETLYLRLDADGPYPADTTIGFYFNLRGGGAAAATPRTGDEPLGFGAQRLIEVTFEGGVPSAQMYAVNGRGEYVPAGEDDEPLLLEQVAAQGGVLELAAPFEQFGAAVNSGDRLNVRVVVTSGGENVAILPADGPAVAVVPDLPLPNVFLELEDHTGDDHGPGGYEYPTDVVFRPGVFDITRVTAGYDDENVIFRVEFAGPVENVWNSPNGLSVQTIDIYIDQDGPSSGARVLLPGRNAALTEDFAWDVAIWAEGWTPGIYTPGESGPVESASTPSISANPGQRRVTISVPRSVLEGNPEDWAYAVVVLGQEGYPSAGVWRVRDVQPGAEQWRIGGGTGSNLDTRILDVLWPQGGEGLQEEFLRNVHAGEQVDLASLEPDEYPRVPMVRP